MTETTTTTPEADAAEATAAIRAEMSVCGIYLLVNAAVADRMPEEYQRRVYQQAVLKQGREHVARLTTLLDQLGAALGEETDGR